MNINDFHKYISQPGLLNASSVAELQEVLESYPYFQTGHILYLKSLFNQNNFKFNHQLKYSSVHINNRKKLLFYLKDKTSSIDPINIESVTEDHPEKEIKSQVKLLASEENIASKSEQKANINTDELKTTTSLNVLKDEQPEASFKKEAPIELPIVKEKVQEHTRSKVETQKKDKSDLNKILEKRLKEIGKSQILPPDNNVNESDLNRDDISDEKEELKPVKENKKVDKIQDFLNKTTSFEAFDDDGVIDLSDLIKVDAPSEYFVKEEAFDDKPKKESLSYWVNHLKNKDKSKKTKIVDTFLKSKKSKVIRAIPGKTHEIPKSITIKNSDAGLMTETLANIYMQQGHYEKALLAYEKLSLKNPKKNTYFANQIKKIKKLQLNT